MLCALALWWFTLLLCFEPCLTVFRFGFFCGVVACIVPADVPQVFCGIVVFGFWLLVLFDLLLFC